MRSTNLARTFESSAIDSIPEVRATLAVAVAATPQNTIATPVPALRVQPLLSETKTRQFVRVPTHAVGVHPEHREYPRATLRLPLRLRSVNDVQEKFPITLVTRDISSSGVFFLAPRELKPGTPIELEVALVERPLGQGRVHMNTFAHIVRAEETDTPGWHGYAASFDDFALQRDDVIPLRFRSA